MKQITKAWTAFCIEKTWWRIARLEKRARHTASESTRTRLAHEIALRRYRAEQLACYYEVLVGLRDTKGKIVR